MNHIARSTARMRRHHPRRRRRSATAAVAILPVLALATNAAAAPVGTPVAIVAHTDFSSPESDFESTLAGCETGTVTDGPSGVRWTPWGGTFIGEKVFECDSGDAGFTIDLRARFGGDGSTGTWTIGSAWGTLADTKGSGSLVGLPTDQGIDDLYTGTIR